MSKKIFCLLLLLIMPVMVLCGCGVSEEAYDNGGADRFKFIEYQLMTIAIDKETRVMYLIYALAYRGGMTVMLNADGTPMLWEGEL